MRRITVGVANISMDGPSNVSNAGIVHMGSRGPGTDPACGTSRAHMTYGKEQFRGLSNKCAKCEEKLAKWDRMKAARGDNAGFMEGVLITGWPSGLVQVTQAPGVTTIDIRRRR